jgi:cob(I)alamin adenosyltransferase
MKNLTYTRTGDEGKTSLIGGLRVAKFDDRVEAYGTVDELSAFVGVLYDQEGVSVDMKTVLNNIQNKLFTIESHFALDENSEVKKMMPVLTVEDVAFLEHEIDVMNEQLPELKSFVIPGGNLKASYAHVCRTICRRAERQGWRLAAEHPIDTLNLKYLNRLSDYFFVLARIFAFLDKVNENNWESDK